jgi:hypothetical protein
MSMGFKKGEAAITCVNFILNQTSQNMREGKTTIIGFLDLSAAFDNVNITKLFQIQQGMKIEDEICVWHHNCLVGRTLMLQINTFEVTEKVYRGLPQGCVLSPTNFILYTTRFHEINSEDVMIIQYADDFAIQISSQMMQ